MSRDPSKSLDCSGKCQLLTNEEYCGVATIPWLPQRTEYKCMCSAGAFHKKFIIANGGNRAVRKSKSDVFDTFARAFPFYLAGRYHRMDGIAIQKSSEVDGRYWLNVGHYLQLVTDRATIPYHNLEHGQPFTPKPKVGNELCETAAEFLLEPWVLLQLPFQPALLHQWAVAAQAEALRCKIILAEIGSRGIAKQFKDLYLRLVDLDKFLFEASNKLLKIFFETYCRNPVVNVPVKARQDFQHLSMWREIALISLEFTLSEHFTNTINFIKRNSWNKSIEVVNLVYIDFTVDIGREASVYCENTWMKSEKFTNLWPDSPALEESCLNASAEFLAKHYGDTFNDQQDVRKAMQACLEEKILKNGPLKGVNNPELLIDTFDPTTFDIFKQTFMDYYKCNALGSSAPGFDHGGIIQQLISLRADAFAERALGYITRITRAIANSLDESVHLDAGDILVPSDYTLEYCMQIVPGSIIESPPPQQWLQLSTDRILKTAKATCEEKKSTSTSNAEATAMLFTERIRKLVLKMHEKHYEWLMVQAGPFHFQPECLYAQYILPCFVATYLDVERDAQVSRKTKANFLRFVHELIKSYEEQEYVQVLNVIRKCPFKDGRNHLTYDYSQGLNFIINLFSGSFESSQRMQYISSAMSHVGEDAEENRPINNSREIFALSDSKNQLKMLCGRLRATIIKISWPPTKLFKLENALDIVWAFFMITMDIKKPKVSDSNSLLICHLNKESKINEKLIQRGVKSAVIKASKEITIPQFWGISLYQAWNHQRDVDSFYEDYERPIFPLNLASATLLKLFDRDWKGMMDLVAPLVRDENGKDISEIPLALAKQNVCCRPLLKSLTTDGRVKMKTPGEITFFPIRHCRWCGLVYCTEFHLCAECKDEPDMPDPNFFCSEKCENEAFDAYHREEHATFTMQQLGLTN